MSIGLGSIMSCNRENVTWKSKDGSWGRGFYDFYQTGEDHEWDVEYYHERFHWASTGHATEEDAHLAWTGANPGGGHVHETPSAETDKFDEMAKTCKQEADRLNQESLAGRRIYPRQ
jgi:hypothetical protein